MVANKFIKDFGKYKELIVKNKYLIILLAVGILLLIFPLGNGNEVKTKTDENIDFEVCDWEKKIESVLGECTGVGRVKVALSVSGTAESVYAEERSQSARKNKDDYTHDSDEKISVLSTGSGVEAPVVIRQLYPEFLGATIVCDGADNLQVQIDVTNAVASLTGISTDRITVIKMKN